LTALIGLRENEIEYIIKNYNVTGLVTPVSFRKISYPQVITDMRPRLDNLRYVLMAGTDVPSDFISLDEIAQRPAKDLHVLDGRRYKPEDVAIVALTSGTTGMPKVAEHVVAARIALGDSYHQKLQLQSNDIVLNVINPVAGLGAPICYSSVRKAVKTTMLEIWNAGEAIQRIEKERPTILLCAPAQLVMLTHEYKPGEHDLSSIRVIFCGTSPLTYEMATRGEDIFGVPVLNAYGSFDGGGISATAVDDDENTRRTSVGKPFPGNEVKIVDDSGNEVAPGTDGEVFFRGPCACSGYYLDPERTKEMWGTGWFKTGDLAKLDASGCIVITGRKKEVIIRGGQNIYPSEIEGLLFLHPKVKHVAVVPMPDAIMGEKACAFVVPKDGEEFAFDEMSAFLMSKKIAKFKIPERLEIRSTLPLRDVQKVAKAGLREEITEILKKEREEQS